jgi:hypothetical protein
MGGWPLKLGGSYFGQTATEFQVGGQLHQYVGGVGCPSQLASRERLLVLWEGLELANGYRFNTQCWF